MSKIKKIIQQAKEILETTPYDIAHDLSHHQRVWQNAQKIVEKENLEGK